LVPLVELSPTKTTDRAVVEEMKALLTSIGKVPVECAASPGYIVPRIQALAMNEAARLVEEGVASAEDIDKAVKYGFGFRFAVLGLLEFIDWGGGDILFHASRYLAGAMGDQRFAAPQVVHTNMAEGRNGLRDGKGFYDYSAMDIAAYRRSRLAEFFRMLQQAGLVMPPADDTGGVV
jgi:3-hydroxybutyryl-CoA dehydrogenase